MRIGIFTDTYPPYINGISTSCVMLKRALEKKGHTVYIVTVNADKLEYKYEDDDKIIRIPGVPIGIYDYRLTGVYPLRIINKIKKWDLDVIHSQTEFGVGTFARIIANQFKIPIVHTYHTMYEDYLYYITKGYFENSSKKLLEYLTKFYCDKTINELIVPTKKIYNLFKSKYKYDRSVHIVPTGIEVERFYKENFDSKKIENLKKKLGIKITDFVILFVGRIAKEKNIDFLIEGIKKQKNVKLLIVGDGPDMDHFKKIISKNKLEDNVIFTGKISYDEIPIYYQVANVFATASVTETQGLTVIEAMAASLPVLVIKDESFEDVVIDRFNGFIFKDKKEYKKLIEELLDNPSILYNIGIQARNFSNNYSSKYFAEKILDVYECAIKNKNKKGFFRKIGEKIKWGKS